MPHCCTGSSQHSLRSHLTYLRLGQLTQAGGTSSPAPPSCAAMKVLECVSACKVMLHALNPPATARCPRIKPLPKRPKPSTKHPSPRPRLSQQNPEEPSLTLIYCTRGVWCSARRHTPIDPSLIFFCVFTSPSESNTPPPNHPTAARPLHTNSILTPSPVTV